MPKSGRWSWFRPVSQAAWPFGPVQQWVKLFDWVDKSDGSAWLSIAAIIGYPPRLCGFLCNLGIYLGLEHEPVLFRANKNENLTNYGSDLSNAIRSKLVYYSFVWLLLWS